MQRPGGLREEHRANGETADRLTRMYITPCRWLGVDVDGNVDRRVSPPPVLDRDALEGADWADPPDHRIVAPPAFCSGVSADASPEAGFESLVKGLLSFLEYRCNPT
jgi:hypothetical protein